MQFFQHFNQPIPPPNTHWLDQHSANQEGDTSVSRLDRASSWHVRIRTIFICMRELQSDVLLAVHERAGGPLGFLLIRLFPPLAFFPSIAWCPLTTLHQRQLAMLLLFSLALSSLSLLLSLSRQTVLAFFACPHSHARTFSLSSSSLFVPFFCSEANRVGIKLVLPADPFHWP